MERIVKNNWITTSFSGLLVMTILIIGLSTTVQAETFTEDGYEVDVQWKYKKKKEKFKAWATIKGGQSCGTLNTTLMFTNGKEILSFESSIKDYQPAANGVEVEPQSQKVSKSKKSSWRAYNVKVECS